MFEVVLVSVFVTLWILLCATLYAYHYFVEVILDLPISDQSPCTAHAALKKIIENLLKESSNLPRLRRSSDHASSSDKNEEGRTYEDLLATAIINKVITTCQNNLPPSSANSVSSKVSGSSSRHQGRSDKEYFFGEETLDSKWKNNDFETSSVSSIDEWLNSESSFGGKKYVDRVSLTIKQEIGEEYPSDSDHGSDVDDTDYFRTNSSLLAEDDTNWFLQKRQFQGTHSPVPVPMLVPNPTTEAKVLIGDKEVDDTSDLSDVASDFEETQSLPSRHGLLIESKTVIGGKNNLDLSETCGRESASSSDSGVKEVNSKLSAFEEIHGAHPSEAGAFQDLHRAVLVKTDISIDDDNVEDSSLLSIYSNTEKEAEYTEKYASLPRTILKPVPLLRPSLQNRSDSENKYHEMPCRDDANRNCSESDNDENPKEFEGSYSKKEKEKWSHPVQLKNNPYSKENIEKRIQYSSSAASSVFGPDYYVRQATSPSGQKVKHDEVSSLSLVSPNNGYNSIHQAVPAYTESDEVFEESKSNVANEQNLRDTATESEPQTSISEITSDSDISYTNFYDVENNKVYKQSKNNVHVIIPEPVVVDKKNNNMDEIKTLKNNPMPKERKTIFIKSNNASRNNFISSKANTLPLRKHRSESDLLAEDSFDRPPTVLQKRKDNTLISKIYLDPNVRSFALKRENLPLEYRPALLKQRSLDPMLLQQRRKNKLSVSSDEGLLSDQDSKTGKMSFFSSEEESISSPERKVQSYSSDEGLLSDSTVQSGRKMYSSSEVLLHEPKKKDNTLISKIYMDPNLKNFTKNTKDVHEARNNRVKTSYNGNVTPIKETTGKSNGVCTSLDDLSSAGFDSDSTYHSTKLSTETQNQDELKASDPEITEIAKKRLVHNRLGWFSQSHSHLEDIHKSVVSDEKEALNVSVKDLRKKFECNDVKSKVVSSLTARSLSKQIREDLKNEQ